MKKWVKRWMCGICVLTTFFASGCKAFLSLFEEDVPPDETNEEEVDVGLEIFEGDYREINVTELKTFLTNVNYVVPSSAPFALHDEIMYNNTSVFHSADMNFIGENDYIDEETGQKGHLYANEKSVVTEKKISIDKEKDRYEVTVSDGTEDKRIFGDGQEDFQSRTEIKYYSDGNYTYQYEKAEGTDDADTKNKKIKTDMITLNELYAEELLGYDYEVDGRLTAENFEELFGLDLDKEYREHDNHKDETKHHTDEYEEEFFGELAIKIEMDDSDSTYTKIKINQKTDGTLRGRYKCADHQPTEGYEATRMEGDNTVVFLYTKDYKLSAFQYNMKQQEKFSYDTWHENASEWMVSYEISEYYIPWTGEITPPSDLASYDDKTNSNEDGANNVGAPSATIFNGNYVATDRATLQAAVDKTESKYKSLPLECASNNKGTYFDYNIVIEEGGTLGRVHVALQVSKNSGGEWIFSGRRQAIPSLEESATPYREEYFYDDATYHYEKEVVEGKEASKTKSSSKHFEDFLGNIDLPTKPDFEGEAGAEFFIDTTDENYVKIKIEFEDGEIIYVYSKAYKLVAYKVTDKEEYTLKNGVPVLTISTLCGYPSNRSIVVPSDLSSYSPQGGGGSSSEGSSSSESASMESSSESSASDEG